MGLELPGVNQFPSEVRITGWAGFRSADARYQGSIKPLNLKCEFERSR
jgi:hypothetical protein